MKVDVDAFKYAIQVATKKIIETNEKFPYLRLENVGIILNNKLNAIVQYYKLKNISFYEESILKDAILFWLQEILNKASLEFLKIFKDENAKMNYTTYCNSIFDFDIAKDLINVLKDYKRFKVFYLLLEKEEQEKCNQELSSLGYSENFDFIFNSQGMNLFELIKDIPFILEKKYSVLVDNIQKTFNEFPHLSLILIIQIEKYRSLLQFAYSNLDLDKMAFYSNKLQEFKVKEEISGGIVNALLDMGRESHLDSEEWYILKSELIQAGFENKIKEIEYKLTESNKSRGV